MNTRLLAFGIFLGLATVAWAQADGPLVGRWTGSNGGQTITMAFQPDGSYTFEVRTADQAASQKGRYALGNATLTLQAADGRSATYDLSLTSTTLVLSGGDLQAPLTLARSGGGGGTPAPGPVAPPANPPVAPPAAAGGPLVGRWTHQSQFLQGWIALLPDGRYTSAFGVAGTELPAPESGRYTFDGAHLTIVCGPNQVTYDIALAGDRMTISGGNFAQPLEYVKEAGSEQRVVGEAQAADAAASQEDAQWAARLAVGPLGPTVRIPAVGEVPDDRNFQRVFPGASVFTGTQLYLWFATAEYMYRPGAGPAGSFKSSDKWFFHSNGRVYISSTMFIGSEKPRDRQQPFWGLYYIDNKNALAYWGRYQIGADDRVHIELDDGSVIDAQFTHGRRNLAWEKGHPLGNVQWEQEALNRQQGK